MRHDVGLRGHASKLTRQIDIAIYEAGRPSPLLIVEVKRHARRVDVGVAGTTIALVQDVSDVPAVMVSMSGFTIGAQNHLNSEGITHITVTLKEAQGLRWIPIVEERFRVDRAFREVSGDLMDALRVGDVAPFLSTDVPYEEWLAIIASGQSLFPETASLVLEALAECHPDDGVRFNAIALLDEEDQLSAGRIRELLQRELDEEVRDALVEALARAG